MPAAPGSPAIPGGQAVLRSNEVRRQGAASGVSLPPTCRERIMDQRDSVRKPTEGRSVAG